MRGSCLFVLWWSWIGDSTKSTREPRGRCQMDSGMFYNLFFVPYFWEMIVAADLFSGRRAAVVFSGLGHARVVGALAGRRFSILVVNNNVAKTKVTLSTTTQKVGATLIRVRSFTTKASDHSAGLIRNKLECLGRFRIGVMTRINGRQTVMCRGKPRIAAPR